MADITKQYLDYAGLTEVVTKIKGLISNSKFSGAAADITIADEAGHFTAENAEAALAELAVAIELLNDTDATKSGTIAKMIKDATGELKIGDTTYTTVKAYVDALIVAVKTLIHGETGSLKDLTTTDKSNLVAAINEVDTAVKTAGTGKADKVTSATAGNFAGLDANGNLTDSGKKADDFDVAGAAAAVSGYTDGETAKTVKEVAGEIAKLGTAAKANVATVAIESETEVADALPTVAQVKAYVQTKTAALAGAVHFRGIVTSLDDITDTKSGDMAIVGVKEYIYNGSAWQELGDEGAYVVKEDGKSLIADTEIARLASMATIKGVDADDFVINAASGELEVASGKQITTTAQVTKLNAIAVSEANSVVSVTDGTNTLKVSSIPLTGDNSIAKLFE